MEAAQIWFLVGLFAFLPMMFLCVLFCITVDRWAKHKWPIPSDSKETADYE